MKAVRVVHGQAQMPLMNFVPKVMDMKEERMSMSASPSRTCVRMVAAGIPLGHSHVAATKAMHWMRMVLSAWVRCFISLYVLIHGQLITD